MIRNLLILSFLFIGFQNYSTAQSYTTAMGIRAGTELGLTLQQKVFKFTTVEGILQTSLRTKQTGVVVLLEQHQRLLSKRLNFYLGGGVHKFWNTDPDVPDADNPYGLTFIAGAEFTISKLNISWDFKPAINIWGGENTFDSQTAISFRYVFIKQKKKEIKWKFWEKTEKEKKKKAKEKEKKQKEKAKEKAKQEKERSKN